MDDECGDRKAHVHDEHRHNVSLIDADVLVHDESWNENTLHASAATTFLPEMNPPVTSFIRKSVCNVTNQDDHPGHLL